MNVLAPISTNGVNRASTYISLPCKWDIQATIFIPADLQRLLYGAAFSCPCTCQLLDPLSDFTLQGFVCQGLRLCSHFLVSHHVGNGRRKQLFDGEAFRAAPLHRWLEKRGHGDVSIFCSLCALSVCGLALTMGLARWA